MTKLDGTAKGGVLVAVTEAHRLPIRFVGVGERAEDLQPFSARAFAAALVGLESFSSPALKP
jgi:fused signal recognition particle receptor